MKYSIVIFILFLSLAAHSALASTSIGVGLSRIQSTWTGTQSEKSYEAKSPMIGVQFNFHRERFYGGLNISEAEYIFNENGPNHPTNVSYDYQQPIVRNNLDLILGYDFWSHGSVFIGTKTITLKWPTGDSMVWVGIGGGVRGFYPLNSHWVLNTSFSFIPMFVDANKTATGRGGFVGINASITYLFATRFYALFGIQSENLAYQVEDEENEYIFGGLRLATGFSY